MGDIVQWEILCNGRDQLCHPIARRFWVYSIGNSDIWFIDRPINLFCTTNQFLLNVTLSLIVRGPLENALSSIQNLEILTIEIVNCFLEQSKEGFSWAWFLLKVVVVKIIAPSSNLA
jgi:hypothetical protein